MITAVNLLLSLISAALSWFFSLNFEGIYIGWIFISVIVISFLIRFFLHQKGENDG